MINLNLNQPQPSHETPIKRMKNHEVEPQTAES